MIYGNIQEKTIVIDKKYEYNRSDTKDGEED